MDQVCPHKTRYAESNRRQSVEDPRILEHRGNFLNGKTMAYVLRSTINKWDLIKLKSFWKAKDFVNRRKWEPTKCKKIFTNSASDRGLISKIYKKLKKFDSIELNNPIKKWSTEPNRDSSMEESQMAEKHLKKCSTSLVIREIQIKTTLRFHLKQVILAKIKYVGDSRC